MSRSRARRDAGVSECGAVRAFDHTTGTRSVLGRLWQRKEGRRWALGVVFLPASPPNALESKWTLRDAGNWPAERCPATCRGHFAAARAVVLVEGVSDQIALEAVAARLGRDLDGEGAVVLPVGGAHGITNYLLRFGPRGADLTLAGLCDAGDPEDTELREAFRVFAEGGELQVDYAAANCANARTPDCAQLIMDNLDDWAAWYETNS